MAFAPQLADWALSRARELQLEVVRVSWTDEWIPGYSDYEARISLNGGIHVGRGLARDERLAFTKAVAESLERAATSLTRGDCRTGTAAHVDFSRAAWNAYCELLGFDRAICHHLCGSRFSRIPLDIVTDDIPLRLLKERLIAHGLFITLCRARPAKDAEVCVAAIWRGSPAAVQTGLVCGFGCDSHLRAAASHAVLECLREACTVFIGGAGPSVPLEELERLQDPQWHFWMTQTRPALEYFQKHLRPTNDAEEAPPAEDVSFADVLCRRLETLDELLPDIPLSIVQARSDRLMTPMFGQRALDEAALLRARRFGGKDALVENSPPHFYG